MTRNKNPGREEINIFNARRKREIADFLCMRYVNPRVCICDYVLLYVYVGLIMRVTVKADETGRRGRDDIARKETRGSRRRMRIIAYAPIETRTQLRQ